MAAVKYKQYYQQMVGEHTDLFAQFKEIHDLYQQNRFEHQDKFNQVGQQVVDIIRDWERRLCSGMGKGVYNMYSHKLSEKFWEQVRKEFAMIDMVGVKLKKVAPAS